MSKETDKSPSFDRRKFIQKAGLLTGSAVVASAGLVGCEPAAKESAEVPALLKQKFKWRCVTVWPPNFPVLGEAVNAMASEINALSNGRLSIQVYGAGELVPALEAFDAVTLGAVQMAHGVSYYWAGKIPAAVFFAAVPFGMNAQQINAWLLYGNGWKLWKDLYAKFGLVPFPCGNTGVQMGGWFNKKIETLADLQGIKMRIPGLGGKVFSRAGGTSVTVAGGEIYTNLERGVIDATEWIGPYHDYLMGFHKVAKYYYYPGWHEPGSVLELFCNKKAFDELPSDLQDLITAVALKYNNLVLAEFEAKNNFYLQKILQESQAQLIHFPEEVLEKLKATTEEVMQELIASDEYSQKVYADFMAFKKDIKAWGEVSEKAIARYL